MSCIQPFPRHSFTTINVKRWRRTESSAAVNKARGQAYKEATLKLMEKQKAKRRNASTKGGRSSSNASSSSSSSAPSVARDKSRTASSSGRGQKRKGRESHPLASSSSSSSQPRKRPRTTPSSSRARQGRFVRAPASRGGFGDREDFVSFRFSRDPSEQLADNIPREYLRSQPGLKILVRRNGDRC